MSGTPKTKPWFEDAATLLKQRYSGSSATADETERRILQAAQRRRRAPKAWWIIPGIIVASGSVAWAKDVYRWTLTQVQEVFEPSSSVQVARLPAPRVEPGVGRAHLESHAAPALSTPELSAPDVTEAALAPPADAAAPSVGQSLGVRHSKRRRAQATGASPSDQEAHPPSDLELYRRGYEAQFGRGDYAAALPEWDNYLKTAPHGQFTPEVRWHRAVALTQLQHTSAAMRALEPFAKGAYGPQRQREAQQLLERLRQKP